MLSCVACSRTGLSTFCFRRNEDAERDCTAVLALSAFNAKALFRRGQARVGLGRLNEAEQGESAHIVLENIL